ncbi:MAG: lysylphosphatidylglycerol synthase transmembrane domain-containing protein [Armatimonadota bacterium]|nr:flippase-like domain-containing protein [Armatimonadota bacterium]MCX7777311.1 flippase-like domain-containing protein [Armatimonadota bacterium]MDW8024372.1 lysylphosphatidylglycerol synthase transmembrane domain-containing protein [Armatimonadota bacterium]
MSKAGEDGHKEGSMKKTLGQLVRALLGWQLHLRIIISLALFSWVIILGHREGVFNKLNELPINVLLMCVCAYCLLQALSAFNWWVIIRATGMFISPLDAIVAFFIGMFFNLFLPGIVGGDMVRAYVASRQSGQPLSRIMGTVYAQRAVGFTSMILVGCVAALWLSRAAQKFVLATLIAFLMLLIIATAAIATLLLWRGSENIWRSRLARFGEGALLFLTQPKHAAICFGIAITYHLCLDAMLLALGWATGMRMGYASYVAMISSLTAISSLPIAIHGLGLREITATHLWVMLGATKDAAILWSLLWRVIAWLTALLGGLLHLAVATGIWRLCGDGIKAMQRTDITNGGELQCRCKR